MIRTHEIERLLGEFKVVYRPDETLDRKSRGEAQRLANINALLKIVSKKPKTLEQIAKEHGGLCIESVRTYIRELENLNQVLITQELVRTVNGNAIKRNLVSLAGK